MTAEQDHTLNYRGCVMNIGLGNLDLGNMINGNPGDPIELYDYCFLRPSILNWWRKRSILSSIGEGGALEEDGKRLALLEEAYSEGTKGLKSMDYNGIKTFDIELLIAKAKFSLTNEEKVKKLMKTGTLKTGGKIAAGETMINGDIALEAWRRMKAMLREE